MSEKKFNLKSVLALGRSQMPVFLRFLTGNALILGFKVLITSGLTQVMSAYHSYFCTHLMVFFYRTSTI